MSANLNRTLNQIFGNAYGGGYIIRNTNEKRGCKFMEIPFDTEEVEIPCLAFSYFRSLVDKEELDKYSKIVVNLYTFDHEPYYRTLNRNLYDILVHPIYNDALIKTKLDPKKDDSDYYYGCLGSIFDKDFKPLMLCSWKLKKEANIIDSDNYIDAYKFIKPIVRIDPNVFASQSDTLQKFISKKFPTSALSKLISAEAYSEHFSSSNHYYDASVVIEHIPFNIKSVSVPSISTDRKQLIKVALDHIDEIIQQ